MLSESRSFLAIFGLFYVGDFQVTQNYPGLLVGTLNLSLEMPNKMQDESGKFEHTILKKKSKVLSRLSISVIFLTVWTECTY